MLDVKIDVTRRSDKNDAIVDEVIVMVMVEEPIYVCMYMCVVPVCVCVWIS